MGTATLGERKLVRGRERSCRRAPGSHCRVKCVPPGVARWGQIPGDVPEGLHIPPGPPGHRKQDVYGVRDPYRACRSSLCEEILVTGATIASALHHLLCASTDPIHPPPAPLEAASFAPLVSDPTPFSLMYSTRTRSALVASAPPLAPPEVNCFRGVQEALPSPRPLWVSSLASFKVSGCKRSLPRNCRQVREVFLCLFSPLSSSCDFVSF